MALGPHGGHRVREYLPEGGQAVPRTTMHQAVVWALEIQPKQLTKTTLPPGAYILVRRQQCRETDKHIIHNVPSNDKHMLRRQGVTGLGLFYVGTSGKATPVRGHLNAVWMKEGKEPCRQLEEKRSRQREQQVQKPCGRRLPDVSEDE